MNVIVEVLKWIVHQKRRNYFLWQNNIEWKDTVKVEVVLKKLELYQKYVICLKAIQIW